MDKEKENLENKQERKSRISIADLAILGMFIAIIILMTAVPQLGYIQFFAIRITMLHIPVIIGSILLGPKKGAILGFVVKFCYRRGGRMLLLSLAKGG